ncbi:hypothetical protein D3C79_1017870 [compost metagenome]
MLYHFIKGRTQPAYFILPVGRCTSIEIPRPHFNNDFTKMIKGPGQQPGEHNRQDHCRDHADQPEDGYG